MPTVRRGASTRLLRPDVFIQRIVSGEQIFNEQFFTGLDRPERVVAKKTLAAKKTGAPRKTVVTKSSAATTKVAVKKTAASPAKRPTPKKVSAGKPAAVNAAPAYPDATAVSEASVLLSA